MQDQLGVRLLTVRGVPVYLKTSWFILMGLVIVGYGLYLGRTGWMLYSEAFTISTTIAVLIALGVLVHELAHAMTGRVRKLRVEYISMTLWGGVTKLSPGSPFSSFLVSIAGPMVNALYALLLYGVGSWMEPSPVRAGLRIAVEANILISIFNMIPSYPLDGGHTLESLVTMASKRRSTGAKVTAWTGMILIPLLVLAAIFTGAWRTTAGLFLVVLVCFYLFSASQPMLKALKNQESGRDPLSARNLARPALVVDEGAPVTQVVSALDGATPVILTRAAQPVGWVPAETVELLREGNLPATSLMQLASPLAPQKISQDTLRIDMMEYFNGYLYQQLPSQLKQGYYPIAWPIIDAQGRPTGVILHRDMALRLSAEQAGRIPQR